jgi:hypothetical protein
MTGVTPVVLSDRGSGVTIKIDCGCIHGTPSVGAAWREERLVSRTRKGQAESVKSGELRLFQVAVRTRAVYFVR